MTIKFLGHACFLLTDRRGSRVMIDPYEPDAFGGALHYAPVAEGADVVLVSHDHADHSYVRGVRGNPVVLRGRGEAAGLGFRATRVPHDQSDGRKRGTSMAFYTEMDGLAVCHLGDLGSTLAPQQAQQIGRVDVLMVPVGGTYTIDADQAHSVIEQLLPRVVIPMHYQTGRTSLPLAPVSRFTSGLAGTERPLSSCLEVTPATVGPQRRVVVLEPAN